jgi:hypothetical protein
MRQQYLPLVVLAILAVFGASGCGILNPPQPTAVPFVQHNVEDVFNAFARAGLQVQNPEQSMSVSGRGAPTGFSNRYLFEIPRIAPAGGQIIIFSSPDQLAAWQHYIDTLRSSADTRRDVVFTYFKENLMLQLSANLTNDEAKGFADAFNGLS